jgi:integrase
VTTAARRTSAAATAERPWLTSPASRANSICGEAGIPLPYIRDILGHVDLSTTEIYARASTEAKRKALEAAYTEIVTDDLPEWNQNPGLLNWLASL